MKRAIIYIRVSTEKQAAEGVSLDAQLAKARAWAELNNYSLDEDQVFRDEGLSAKRADNRPGLQAALSVIEKDDVLVVYSLSRLARSTKDAIEVSDKLHKIGADLVSLTESIDTTSAAGKMVFGVLAVLAQFERDLVSERTRGAMLYLKQARLAYCRPVYGWDVVNGKLQPNPAEQAVLDRITGMRAGGESLDRIAAHLTAGNVPTKRGGVWRRATIRQILANDLRAGEAE